MDLPRHWSLHRDNDDHFLIHDKRVNKTFPVAKKDLHPATQIKIMKMQKFEGGGDVQDLTPDYATMPTDNIGAQSPPPENNNSNWFTPAPPQLEVPAGMPEAPAPNQAQAPQINAGRAPESSGPQDLNASTSSQDFKPTPGYSTGELNRLEKDEASASNDMVLGQQEQNRQTAEIWQKHLAIEQAAQQHFQESSKRYQDQADKLSNDIATGKIDPNKYWGEKSTGSKVSSMLAIFLGSLGQGLTHGSTNVALDNINRNIDRDIDAQKAELGKKQNLLSDNLRIQGNLAQAESATRLQQSAILQGQLAMTIAKTNDPLVKSRAAELLLEKRRQDIPLKESLAANETQNKIKAKIMDKMKQGGNVDAVDLVNAGVIPKEYQADAYKEQSALNAKTTAVAQATDLFRKMNDEQSGKNLLNPQSASRMAAYKSELVNTIMNASASKRLTRESIEKEIAPLEIGTLNDKETRDAKLQSVLGMIQKHSDPTPLLEKYGVTKPYEVPAEVKKMGGVNYKKVPGGWKKLG